MSNFESELQRMRQVNGIYDDAIECSSEESLRYNELLQKGMPLPDGVTAYKTDSGGYVFFKGTGTYQKDIFEFLFHKQIAILQTIGNCMLYFTILSAVCVGIWLIYWIITSFIL